MPEYSSWEESKGRIADRFESQDKTLAAILRNVEWLLRLLGAATLGLLGHAVVSYLQMAAKH